MHIIKSILELRRVVLDARRGGARIGCVPTMGALHAGHMSLIAHCHEVSSFVVVTIFVNPTQFAPHEDLSRYPRPLEADLANCRAVGAHAVFLPDKSTLYPKHFQTWVTVEHLSTALEGAHRPQHFRGVTTIVAKLFNLVQPDVACFGAKDFQQQALIRRMVIDLDMPIDIITCPTVRDADGLALSSRNIYLSPQERESALSLSKCLKAADRQLRSGDQEIAAIEQAMVEQMQNHPGVTVDYARICDPGTLEFLTHRQPSMVGLVAARVGSTRLIDNMLFEADRPSS